MWLFAAFVAVPLIEIALFIQVGGLIGLWPTLAIVVLTAVAGTMLFRVQGAGALGDLRRSFNTMSDPSEHLAHGAMILFSGALLLTPGFFTDAVGFALLVPGVRKWVMKEAGKRVKVQSFSTGPQQGPRPGGAGPSKPRGPGDVIEGDYSEVEIREPDPDREPSRWTRR